ncbi:baseplate multidomain protein megatron [Devosia submarina]|uniref:baseplate multidomain protein megatron n=1 Tax=Devosia submarina TaxID=1173082 RepID=UPI0013006EAF|nr:glycoside hydrolase/phage tail family protein [Devosia submarina]
MATLSLSLAGQFAGGLVGGPIGATIGRALGALAGSAVDGMLFGETPQRPANDIRLQGSSEGGAIPRLYGWSRLAGNIIWARELELLNDEDSGAKAMGAPREDEVGASFAVAFCEGPVSRMGRIWADGQLLDTEGLTLRFYRGTEDQLPDGLIETTQGVAPAYRGLCYLVVEQLPLSRFGNRIPQLSVELCRAVGDLEGDIEAVTLIPGATEFGYDPVARVRIVGPGATVGENVHASAEVSDWTLSIDELAALCPRLEHVAVVIAWFGDDLRCDHCTVGPRVEAASRDVVGVSWSVMGLGRGDVPVVSSHNGGPAYGGTPSDASVLAAIADLKSRGIAVTLYPLVMMDIPSGNGLPDPYGGAEQASYPWRGRIMCDPAVEGTAEAVAQVLSFAGRFRSMALHYAALSVEAGGVDALVIGSEMRGMTTVRGPDESFPFVDALVALAADVRQMVGPATKLTYAADWSEYGGYQPPGEKFFHLDQLWASPDIDAVGIDNYMPIADWRDGTAHADAPLGASIYELDYLAGNVAGGEGYDWFYMSDADRHAQLRTPITDGAHDEPWVYRFKDIRNWWSQPHFNRPGGTRSATPTQWVPGGKPIWFTELGCAAVDKGANQPNIFGDSKSAEDGRPYHSSGAPDPLMQRQALRAHHRFWRNPANNPAGMVDVERIYHWTWDARPYPAFPAQEDVWADGVNHRTGHWLTGRLGGASSDEIAVAVARDHGADLRAEPAAPLIGGYVLEQATTARDALEPILQVTGLSLRSRAEGLELASPRRDEIVVLDPDDLVLEDGPVLSRRRGDPSEAPGQFVLSFADREWDYLTASVTAVNHRKGPLAGEASSLVLDGIGARLAAERMLDARSERRETLEFTLPPSQLALEPGDVIDIAGLAEGPFEIVEIRDGLSRHITAQTLPVPIAIATEVERAPRAAALNAVRSIPVVTFAHLPPRSEDGGRSRLVVGAFASPWPGSLDVVDDITGARLVQLSRRARLGVTTAAFAVGSVGGWDESQSLEIALYGGHLASVTPDAVQAGSNRIAVQSDGGGWEVLGFAEAQLTAPGRYRLSKLLRGLDGTAAAMGNVSAGGRVMVLDGRVETLLLDAQSLGQQRQFRIYAGPSDLVGAVVSVTTSNALALPLAPVHLRAQRLAGGDVMLTWVRGSPVESGGGENYAISISDDGAVLRTFASGSPMAIYSAAEQIADFGVLPDSFDFTIAQVSAALGAGAAGEGTFS